MKIESPRLHKRAGTKFCLEAWHNKGPWICVDELAEKFAIPKTVKHIQLVLSDKPSKEAVIVEIDSYGSCCDWQWEDCMGWGVLYDNAMDLLENANIGTGAYYLSCFYWS